MKRGDRLLEVDGQAVANKKLVDIYKIFLKAFPGKTDVKITKMRHCPSTEIKRENAINGKYIMLFKAILRCQQTE